MKTFISRRWQGLVDWKTLFWRDLLVIGTGLNLLMPGTALVLGASLFWLVLFVVV